MFEFILKCFRILTLKHSWDQGWIGPKTHHGLLGQAPRRFRLYVTAFRVFQGLRSIRSYVLVPLRLWKWPIVSPALVSSALHLIFLVSRRSSQYIKKKPPVWMFIVTYLTYLIYLNHSFYICPVCCFASRGVYTLAKH